MTTPRRFESDLPALLADLYLAGTPDYRDHIVQQTARVRQRPAWTFPERWLPVELTSQRATFARLPLRQLGVLALIAILLAAALAVYIGSRQPRLPAPFGPAANGLIPYTTTDGDIFVGDLATGGSRPLVQSPDRESGPVVSRDGTKVAFARDIAKTTLTDVFVIGIDGTNLHKITPTAIDRLQWGEWTPDGRLALIHEVYEVNNDCQTARCMVGHLDLLDADGSGHTVAVAAEPRLDYVRFRPPAGGELLYRALVDGRWGLFAMNGDGTNVHPIVPATVPGQMDATFGTANYSPDGRRVFFDSFTNDASGGDPGCCQLFVVDADGTNLHKFVSSTIGVWDGEASMSPDGSHIAFWHNLPDRANRIAIVRADGTGDLVLTGPDFAGGAHWVWAPDSSKILAFRNDLDNGSAVIIDPNGGPWTTVPWSSNGDLDWQRLALPS